MSQETEALERIKAAMLSVNGGIAKISDEDKELIYIANKFSTEGKRSTTLLDEIIQSYNPNSVLHDLDPAKIKIALNKLGGLVRL